MEGRSDTQSCEYSLISTKFLIDKSISSKLAAEAVANCNQDSKIFKLSAVTNTEALELVA